MKKKLMSANRHDMIRITRGVYSRVYPWVDSSPFHLVEVRAWTSYVEIGLSGTQLADPGKDAVWWR